MIGNGVGGGAPDVIGPRITFPEIHLVPSSMVVNVGTPTGDVTDVQHWQDGNVLQIAEAASTPGMDVVFKITGVRSFRRIGCAIRYQGSTTHWLEMGIYDNAAAAYKVIHSIENSNGQSYRFSDIPPNSHDFVNDDHEVLVRVYHPTGGNAAHNAFIDYLALVV